ncbi:MAG: conjugative transposon protein TraM, partial [Chryseobacterium sp.]
MKEFENKVRFIGENNDPEKTADMGAENKSNKDQIKKSLIFGLMGIVFAACIY